MTSARSTICVRGETVAVADFVHGVDLGVDPERATQALKRRKPLVHRMGRAGIEPAPYGL